MKQMLYPCLMALSLSATPAIAQSPVSPGSEQADAVLSYEPDFFADFNPQTALDLVSRVPGFDLQGGNGGRGLDSALGNVLIDGRRPSSKAGVTTLLQRLPAATVLRVELIRSPIPGIDMAGQDQVVNVITDRSGGWSGAWSGEGRLFESGRLIPRGEASMTRTSPNATLTLAIDLAGHANGRDELRRTFDLTNGLELDSQIQDRFQERFWDLTPSVGYQRQFDAGHSLRVDARAWAWSFAANRSGFEQNAQSVLLGSAASRSETEEYGTEVSADYDHRLNEVWSLKLTALQRLTTQEGNDRFVDFAPTGALDDVTRITETEDEGETVLRLEARRANTASRSRTFILEGAYNFLEGDFDLFVDGGAGEIEVVLPVSDTRVEEHRVNAGVSELWRLSPQWTLDATAAVEFSRIAQTGDAEKERTFTYFKPEATLTWTPREADQIRFNLRRSVGQLSFGDFISSVDVVDDTESLGNPNLEPERTTAAQIEWTRRFWQEGAFTVILRHEWVEGVLDNVPVGISGDAPGNLGDGQRSWIEFEADLPTDRLGISGGLLVLSGRLRDTNVPDPVTRDDRRFRGDEDWRFSLDFRQDLPDWGAAWGFDYSVQGDEDFYRRREFSRTSAARGNLDVFVEKQIWSGMTARLGLDLNGGENGRERYRWPVSRDIGVPTQLERREQDSDGFVTFALRGVF
ncbi:TonB-dependent receptor plug domain-containing protein [Oceanicaulis sp.]|uniref:TonB-dependent receptor plug domain-containing protein n=1 Tax=Oceanicaulis sp. TaxID=1924941 RepID=UPI003BA990BD